MNITNISLSTILSGAALVGLMWSVGKPAAKEFIVLTVEAELNARIEALETTQSTILQKLGNQDVKTNGLIGLNAETLKAIKGLERSLREKACREHPSDANCQGI
jgi:hypothetical protein